MTVLHQSGLEGKFWEYAFGYVNYLHNRLPNAEGKSAYEEFCGKKPSLPEPAPFGCLVHARKPPRSRRKMESRVDECVMLGHCPSTKKGYYLLGPDNRVVVRKDVTIFPHVFPFAKSQGSGIRRTVQKKPGLAHVTRERDPGDQKQQNAAGQEEKDQDEKGQEGGGDSSESDDHPQEHQPRRSGRRNQGHPVPRLGRWDNPSYANRGNQERAHFTFSADPDPDPSSYKEAMESADSKQWEKAVQEELQSHEENATWSIERPPRGEKVIGARWVFKKKRNRDGDVVRFKARLVAKGFSQVEGVHYKETFAPTLKFNSLRLVLSIAAQRGWTINQLDVKTAFLIPELPEDEQIYMKIPDGVLIQEEEIEDEEAQELALKLQRSLYGLKQAPRHWNEDLHNTLTKFEYNRSEFDPCVYIKTDQNGRLVSCVLVYVDDCLILGPDSEAKKIKAQLMSEYKMTDGGVPSWFLGLAVDYDKEKGELHLSQEAYVERLLESHGMSNAASVKTPAATKRLAKAEDQPTQEEEEYMNSFPYRQVVGSLLYLTCATRPDIAFAVQQLGRHVNNFRQEHWKAAKRVLRYLKGTSDFGITYTRSKTLMPPEGFADADFAQDEETRRSVGGYVFMMNGGPVSWLCKQQSIVARSSAEAELIALDDAVREALWQRKSLPELGFPEAPTVIHEDNQSCIAIATNTRFTSATKHISTRYFAVRHHLASGEIKLEYCPTTEMIADIFTKPLGAVLFKKLRQALRLTSKKR